MLDERLDDVTRERAKATAIDWGNAWLGPVDGALAAFPAEAAAALGVRALPVLDRAATDTLLEPVRRRPAHASELVSEVRAGEALRRILREGDWWLLAGEDDYVGWVHDWVLRPLDDERWQAWHARWCASYARPLGTLWVSDHHAGSPLVLGTPLLSVDAALRARGEWILVATTTGAEGWLHRDEVRGPVESQPVRLALDAAHMLMGTPYRWGGCSPLGFDCSGFIQFVARWAGVALPRDAAQQQRVGEEIGSASGGWAAGDLLFFGERADHVGLYDGRQGMIHCRGRVRRDALGDLTPLMARLRTVRRPWSSPPPLYDSLWIVKSMPGS